MACEASRASAMTGLNAARKSVASISSQIASSRPFSTDSVTGSLTPSPYSMLLGSSQTVRPTKLERTIERDSDYVIQWPVLHRCVHPSACRPESKQGDKTHQYVGLWRRPERFI